jgi:hypothetical protein
MKFNTLATAAALALAGLSVPALAQGQATVGTKIFGSDGGEVGVVQRVDGGNVVIDLGSVTAAIPNSSIGEGEKGATIGWTKAELEAAVNQANAQAAAALTAALVTDAEIYSTDKVLLGKVKEITADDLVVVELASGPASLPKTQMAMQDGKLTFLATAAAVEAAANPQGGD